MADSLQHYIDEWTAPNGQYVKNHPLDVDLAPTACVIDEVIWDSIGSGPIWTTDFGNAICWFLYFRLEEDRDREVTLSQEQRDRIERARVRLQELLTRYVHNGYTPAMKQELANIVNADVPGYSIDDIYVLPGDLPALLAAKGNPLIDNEEYEEQVRTAPLFDLTNPEHREALRKRLIEASQ